MHISDGVLPMWMVASGGVTALGLGALTLPKLSDADVPKTAVMTAAFFVSSLLAFPIGGTSVHLSLTGLMGALLGAAAFPAVLVGLVLQATLLGHGGLTTLGVNAVTIGGGALVAGMVFRRLAPETPNQDSATIRRLSRAGALAGGLGFAVSLALYAAVLISSGNALGDVARLAVLANLPVLVIETLVSGAAIGFIARVEPRLLRRGVVLVLWAGLGGACLFGAPREALAHGVRMEATITRGRLHVEAWFTDGTPFSGARVTATFYPPKGSTKKATTRRGTLDRDGIWETALVAGSDRVRVAAQDATGHRVETLVRLEGLEAHGLSSNAGKASRRPRRHPPERPWIRVALGLLAIGTLAVLLQGVQRRRRHARPERGTER